jgi:hypothetical protein
MPLTNNTIKGPTMARKEIGMSDLKIGVYWVTGD